MTDMAFWVDPETHFKNPALALWFDNAFQLVVNTLATIITVCIVVSGYLAIVSVIAIAFSVFLLVVVDRTLRETKRLSNGALNPVLSNIGERYFYFIF
jgi:hypothetical protein